MKKIIFASLLLLGSVSYAQGPLNWSETINQVAPSIVSIQFDIPLAANRETHLRQRGLLLMLIGESSYQTDTS
jgi:hypothetical protein